MKYAPMEYAIAFIALFVAFVFGVVVGVRSTKSFFANEERTVSVCGLFIRPKCINAIWCKNGVVHILTQSNYELTITPDERTKVPDGQITSEFSAKIFGAIGDYTTQGEPTKLERCLDNIRDNALERRCKFDDVHAGDYTKTR